MEEKTVDPEVSAAAKAMRLVNSPKQQAAAKQNGMKGGRPKGQPMSEDHKEKLRQSALARAAAKKGEQQ